LFELLDADRDGKLSRKELEAAEKVLAPFDQNDDELISLAEVQAGPQANYPYTPLLGRPGRPNPSPPASLLLVPRDGVRRASGLLTVARDVLKRYDRDRDGKLSSKEVALTGPEFARLDTNGDGKLDVLELLRWLGGKPDAEMTFLFGGQAVMGRPA